MLEIFNFYHYTILAATCISALHFWSEKRSKEHSLIFTFILTGLIVEVTGRILGFQGINNSWLFNALFVHVQTGLALAYIGLTSQSARVKKNLMIFLGLLSIFSVFNGYFLQNPLQVFQLYSFRLGSFTIIIAALIYFYRINFKGLHENENLLLVPSFWNNSFFLFFYSGSFLYFSSIYYIYEMDLMLMDQLNIILKLLGLTMYTGLSLSYFAPNFKQKNTINQPQKEL
jgi:hypothetical protein